MLSRSRPQHPSLTDSDVWLPASSRRGSDADSEYSTTDCDSTPASRRGIVRGAFDSDEETAVDMDAPFTDADSVGAETGSVDRASNTGSNVTAVDTEELWYYQYADSDGTSDDEDGGDRGHRGYYGPGNGAYADYVSDSGEDEHADVSDFEYEYVEVCAVVPAAAVGASVAVAVADAALASEESASFPGEEPEEPSGDVDPPQYNRVGGWTTNGAADPPGYDAEARPPTYGDMDGSLSQQQWLRRQPSTTTVQQAQLAARGEPREASRPTPALLSSSLTAEPEAQISLAGHRVVHGNRCSCSLCVLIYRTPSPAVSTRPPLAPHTPAPTQIERLQQLSASFRRLAMADERTPLNTTVAWIAQHSQRQRRKGRRMVRGPRRTWDIAKRIFSLRGSVGKGPTGMWLILLRKWRQERTNKLTY